MLSDSYARHSLYEGGQGTIWLETSRVVIEWDSALAGHGRWHYEEYPFTLRLDRITGWEFSDLQGGDGRKVVRVLVERDWHSLNISPADFQSLMWGRR